jgi:transposase-like protein
MEVIMAGKDIIVMSRKELKRLGIVKKVLEKGIKQVEAAEYLGLSSRHINRIVQRVRTEGENGVIHRLRGAESNRKYPEGLKKKVINLYEKKYDGFGPLLASEKLSELYKIKISDETLRKWLIAADKWKKGRKGRKHRHWRERKGRYGEMVQMDGSHHNWLEGRGPELVLMGYIDDATGKVYGRFYDYEGTLPAMDSFKRYMRKHGIPHTIYLDKHTTYKSWAKPTIESELTGKEPLSQFKRALYELGVEVIHADSPQAKGRIERLFRTFQDRVIKEMRLRGIKTSEAANAFLEGYLPVFNAMFNVMAREKGDLHRKVARGINLDRILCIKETRVLRNDFTVIYGKKIYQVLDKIKARKVTIEERLDGTIKIYDKNQKLQYKEVPFSPLRVWQKKEIGSEKAGKQWIPPADHPWRKFKISPAAFKSTAL